jgi:pimeloyl-ACP methyl ester carboxylesterase
MISSATISSDIRFAKRPGVTIEYTRRGSGPSAVMIPGWGRGPEDYDHLADALVSAGYCALQPQPRSIKGSQGPMEGVTLVDLAEDVAAVIQDAANGPAVVIGHALGNRVGRMLAALRPALVKAVVLLAAGGKVPARPDDKAAWSAAVRQIEAGKPTVEAIQRAYFAPGNDGAGWVTGWHPAVRVMQNHAVTTATLNQWWTAGDTVPLLVVQGRQDIVAPPENGYQLKADVGDRATLVDIDNAGHALLFEQPAAIATAVLGFLAKVAPTGR